MRQDIQDVQYGLKIYIGHSIRIKDEKINGRKKEGRISNHLRKLRKNKHENDYLQRSFNKYGEENFEWKIIKCCKEEELLNQEQYYINIYQSANYNCGYNENPIASKPPHTEESHKKSSESHKGHTPWNKGIKYTDEQKKNLQGINLGRKHTEQTRRNMSKAQRGKKMTKEAVEKTRLKLIGHNVSQETREKLRQKNLGKKLSEDSKRKIVLKNTGRKHTLDTIKRIKEKNPRIYDCFVSQWKEFFKQGYSYNKIAKKYNTNHHTVKKYLVKFYPEKEEVK